MRAAFELARARDQRERQRIAETHIADGDDGIGRHAPTLRSTRPPVNWRARSREAGTETAPGRCGGGNPGPLSFIGLRRTRCGASWRTRLFRTVQADCGKSANFALANWKSLRRRHGPSNTSVAPSAACGPTISLSMCSAARAPSCGARSRHVAHRKAHRRKPHAARHVRRLDRVVQPEGGRVHHLDLAARRLDGDAARGRFADRSRRRRLSGRRDDRPDSRRRTRRPRRPSRCSRWVWNAGFQKFSG